MRLIKNPWGLAAIIILSSLSSKTWANTSEIPTWAAPPNAAVSAEEAPIALPKLRTESIAKDPKDAKKPFLFQQPIQVLQAPGNNDTLFVVERAGRILQVQQGKVLTLPFADLSARVWIPPQQYSENGLLSVAFHPDYAKNGRVFMLYTAKPPASKTKLNNITVLAEMHRDWLNPLLKAQRIEYRLLELDDRAGNHNGGTLAFGRDGFLYMTLGDEGDRCDSFHNAQNLKAPFGKLHRFDVSKPGEAKPAKGNPNLGPAALKSIWAYGLRNVWRMSFDRETGNLYMADVGQDKIEEINVQPFSSKGGENYGWPVYEAGSPATISNCPEPKATPSDVVYPAASYTHDTGERAFGVLAGGKSITGGYVYRGKAIPQLYGVYLFGDFVSNKIGALRWFYKTRQVVDMRVVDDLSHIKGAAGLASFGEDNTGELYLVYLASGHVLKIAPQLRQPGGQ